MYTILNCSTKNEYVVYVAKEKMELTLPFSKPVPCSVTLSSGIPTLSNSSMMNRAGTLIRTSAKRRNFSLSKISMLADAASRSRSQEIRKTRSYALLDVAYGSSMPVWNGTRTLPGTYNKQNQIYNQIIYYLE